MSLVEHAPLYSAEEAASIAYRLYGIKGHARPLPSERDQNFQIDAGGDRYVLKIANEREEPDLLDAQNHVLQHIAQTGSAALGAVVLRTVAGETIARTSNGDGASHYVRLLSYVPGIPLALVRPHAPELMTDLGRFLGELDAALSTFRHPALQRTFHWDLAHAGSVVAEQIDEIESLERRSLVAHFLARFAAETAPHLAVLPHQAIHGDANDYNVLVAGDGDLFSRYRHVSGILDYGDMVHGLRVADLAIAAAYVLLDKEDPLAAVAQVTAGYYVANPLTEAELAALWDLTCMRLCMSVCHAAHQRRLRPENEYLSISERPAWEALEQLKHIHPRLAHYTVRAACGLPANPASATVTAWLATAMPSPVVPADLHTGAVHVLDLSIGSPTLTAAQLLSDRTDTLSATIFNEIAVAGAPIGIGRYDEARPFYTGPAFAVSANPTDERRTFHLGIDLFAPAGTPVAAPLDSIVHAVADNRARHDYGPVVILRHETGDGLPFYTLYGHLGRDCLGLAPGQALAAGETFATLGAAPDNGDWPPHLHLQLITDLLELDANFPGVAAPSRRTLWTSLSPDPNGLLGIPAECFPAVPPASAATLVERRARLGRNLSIAYRRPIKIVRGLRQYLYDGTGRPYLDGVNNVAHVGHCHPHVIAAGQRQMEVLNTNTRYLHDTILEYARRLSTTLPPALSIFYFVNSGSEANDLALRLARTATDRQDVITLDVAYHGHTQSLIEVSPYKHDGPGGKGRPPFVQKVIMPDPYRGPYLGYGAASGKAFAGHVEKAVQQIGASGRGVAAFICESLMGCGGQIVFPDTYMAEAFHYVRAAGGICIADEVQTGFGRVGTHFWGFQTQGVVPDIVTMGKPAGNGHPLAVVATTAEIADRFANGMEYFNTFGGNPVSCAIGLAVLDVIEQEGLQENACVTGDYLMAGLRKLQDSHQIIGDVRGLGLYIGTELVLDRQTMEPAGEHASYIANRMRDYGVLISTDGPFHNVLKIKPPIIFSRADADHLLWALGEVLCDSALTDLTGG